MKSYFSTVCIFGFALCSMTMAQDKGRLPDKLATLKAGYEAAITKATIPITQTYIRELEKLKTEYTKAGNLEAAIATDILLKESLAASANAASKTSRPTKLSQMSIDDFKAWLATVSIVESNGEKTTFEYDGVSMISSRPSAPTPRTHSKTEVEVGIISVPFSTDIAVIRVSDNLKSATVRYDEEPQLEAKIRPKK